jgi:hypothetical protein
MLSYAINAVLFSAIRDAYLINKGIAIKHKGLWKWVFIAIFHLTAFYFSNCNLWYIIYAICVQVILFDISLNLMRGLKWNYIDDPDPNEEDSLWDTFFHDKPFILYISRSIALLIVILLEIYI